MSLPLEGLAPPASLRLENPVWGVDPSTKEMAFAAVRPRVDLEDRPDSPDLAWRTVGLLERAAGPHLRWAHAAHRIHSAVQEFAVAWGRPDLVLVEQPFSGAHHTEPSSYYAVACLLAGLGQLGTGTVVEMVPPQTWKSLATGHGWVPEVRAIKDSRARYKAEKARLLEWAQSVGYTGLSSNEADAVGLAVAAGVRVDGRLR